MLKQIAFGSIALTATGYGIKKLYEKLSKPERKFDTHAIVPSCKDMIKLKNTNSKESLKSNKRKIKFKNFFANVWSVIAAFHNILILRNF